VPGHYTEVAWQQKKSATRISGFPQKVKQKMPWKEVNTDGTKAMNQLQSLEKNKKKT